MRQLLVRRAISRLHAESKLAMWLQIALPLGSALLGAVVAMWLMGSFASGTKRHLIVIGISSNFLGGGIGCVVGTLSGLALRACKLRRYLRRLIEEYEFETRL